MKVIQFNIQSDAINQLCIKDTKLPIKNINSNLIIPDIISTHTDITTFNSTILGVENYILFPHNYILQPYEYNNLVCQFCYVSISQMMSCFWLFNSTIQVGYLPKQGEIYNL